MAISTEQAQKTGFVGNVDWDEYIRYRPKYPQEFFERIYTQVEKSNGTFRIVNDCGAGGGVASQVLAKKFDKVIVSEPNKEFLLFAKARLTPMFSPGKFEFLNEGAEKSSLESGSIDAVTICEALHWCDIPTALAEFHRQLKPGGVLSILHYMIAYLFIEEAQEIWMSLWNKGIRTVQGPIYQRSMENVGRGYTNIVFEEEKWKDVKRVMVNCEGTWKTIALVYEGSANLPDGVGKNDEVIYDEENAHLMLDVDLEGLKRLFYAMLPWVEDRHEEEWEKLESIVGKGNRFKGYYPATQLIATKR